MTKFFRALLVAISDHTWHMNPIRIALKRSRLRGNLRKFYNIDSDHRIPVASRIENVAFDGSNVRIIANLSENSSSGCSGGIDKNRVKVLERYLYEIARISGFPLENVKVICTADTREVRRHATPSVSAPKPTVKSNPRIKKIVGIASCKGGVGKSTLAVNLALNLASRGMSVGLLDADIYGPSVPVLLNLQDFKISTTNADGAVGPAFVDIGGADGVPESGELKVVSIDFLQTKGKPLIWRGPIVSKAIKSLFEKTKWEDLDFLIIDLPPGTGDVYLSLLQEYQVNSVVLVSTDDMLSVSELERSIGMLREFDISMAGVFVNMTNSEFGTKVGEDLRSGGSGSDALWELVSRAGLDILGSSSYNSSRRIGFANIVPLNTSLIEKKLHKF